MPTHRTNTFGAAAATALADFDADGDLTLFDFMAYQIAFAVECP